MIIIFTIQIAYLLLFSSPEKSLMLLNVHNIEQSYINLQALCRENGSAHGQDSHLAPSACSLHTVGNMFLFSLAIKEPRSVLWAAELQESRGWRRDWNGCRDGEAQRQRPGLLRAGLPWGGRDYSTWPAMGRIKLGINPSPQELSIVIFQSNWIKSELALGWHPLARHPPMTVRPQS